MLKNMIRMIIVHMYHLYKYVNKFPLEIIIFFENLIYSVSLSNKEVHIFQAGFYNNSF